NGVTRTPGVAQTISVPNGTVAITAAGAISFTPTADYNGTTSFSYVARDPSGATSTASISIVVASVNDAPTQSLPPTQNGTED
ncbi:Ig-like domain-containing protein, partial [Acinetobacter baumannii]|uniref:Ig-like domain-containing protein n=1 Tax=Acinetobacter baumannii TaxID=470 RepID=UPI0037898A60